MDGPGTKFAAGILHGKGRSGLLLKVKAGNSRSNRRDEDPSTNGRARPALGRCAQSVVLSTGAPGPFFANCTPRRAAHEFERVANARSSGQHRQHRAPTGGDPRHCTPSHHRLVHRQCATSLITGPATVHLDLADGMVASGGRPPGLVESHRDWDVAPPLTRFLGRSHGPKRV